MNKNLNIVVLIAFNFLLLNVLSQEIETTTITCLTVQADGSVGITWTPIPDENGIFNQYNIASHNTNTQNSTAFESEPDINNTFFLDNSVNAGAGPVSYQIVIEPISSTT